MASKFGEAENLERKMMAKTFFRALGSGIYWQFYEKNLKF
jgi:hypothetical protein